MSRDPSNTILIAGGGIAGLTAAIALSARGFAVEVYEQSKSLEIVGAGIQLSPNATRILSDLDVLQRLQPTAVEPSAVVLRRADRLQEIARVPLGEAASRRWGSPYLVCHRGDLQAALLNTASQHRSITITTGAEIRDFDLAPPRLSVDAPAGIQQLQGALVVAADGVWSAIRSQGGQKGESRFVGQLAWRRTLPVEDPVWSALAISEPVVTAFLHPNFHLIAYPMRGGREINLAGFTSYKQDLPRGWRENVDVAVLRGAMKTAHPDVAALAEGGDWTAYPIHVADLDGAWSDPGGLALIGDAAHAMTPFAAQGAAMAIEDAATLANAISPQAGDFSEALRDWTVARRRRVLRVARRGALNQFAWHAGGPVGLARDLFLKFRGPEKLAADLDWLYGWRPA